MKFASGKEGASVSFVAPMIILKNLYSANKEENGFAVVQNGKDMNP
jgi:hypothetical protein